MTEDHWHGEYLVTGKREYRGHAPGTTFEALLAAGPEGRAIARGDIRLLRRVRPALVPDSYRIHPSWTRESSTPHTIESVEGR